MDKKSIKHARIFFTTYAIALVGMFAIALLCTGCDRELVPVQTYASTNTPPSRFKVVSSDYYNMQFPGVNLMATVLMDTHGTNDILVVSSEHGLTMMYIPKPVKQLEDNK